MKIELLIIILIVGLFVLPIFNLPIFNLPIFNLPIFNLPIFTLTKLFDSFSPLIYLGGYFFLLKILPILAIIIICSFIIQKSDRLNSKFGQIKLILIDNTISGSKVFQVDLIRFLLMSILLTFFIHVVLSKTTGESVFVILLNFIPNYDFLNKYTDFNHTITIPFYGNITLIDIKLGNVEEAFKFLTVPVGAILLFILRQLHYKSNKKKYPGTKILSIFIILISIIVIIDLLTDLGILPFSTLEQTSNYDLDKFKIFIFSYLIEPSFYITIFLIWILDRYLLSKYWIKAR